MSTINDIGIPGVGSGINQPKQKHKWRVTFAGLGGGADSQPLSMQIVTFSKPKLTFEKIALHRYNSTAFIAGKHTWDPVNVAFQDDVSSTASTTIMAQLQKQQWLIGAEGQWMASATEASIFKFVTYFDSLDGNDQVLDRWTLEGCWFESVDYSEVDYSSSDPVMINTVMSIDHARYAPLGYRGGRGIATGGAGKA